MVEAAPRITSVDSLPRSKKKPSGDDSHNILGLRRSKELIIALCGPIGCGIRSVKEQLEAVLHDEQYKVELIRVSKQMEDFSKKNGNPIAYKSSSKADRYNALMDAGDELRSIHGNTIGADLAISEISMLRQKASDKSTASNTPSSEAEFAEDKDNFNTVKEAALSTRTAYIIDQLKHPDEVHSLKRVYGNIFYFVGVLCDEERRKVSLKDEGIEASKAHLLIERDKDENLRHGQQLEKTLYHADLFINNSDPNASTVNFLLGRFLKLAHGGRGITPTTDESGMYSAYSASLQSACLSRQVGASIVDEDGIVVAIGHNDVPKYGGGLYTEDDNIIPNMKDYRCVHRDQRCHNDLHKLKLKDRVEELLVDCLDINLEVVLERLLVPRLKDKITNESLEEILSECKKKLIGEIDAPSIANTLYEKSQIKSLIEYSRAIHAEMDAIVSVARRSAKIPKNSTLFTTTFPCHNCARHIIAAGIKRVVYVEPYEKSLAINLHDDAISYIDGQNKVLLIPFQGIAPARYKMFFSNTTPKKDKNGRIIISDREDAFPVDTVPVDSYLRRESKVAEEYIKILHS